METTHPLQSSKEIEHLLGMTRNQICQIADSAHGLYESWDVREPGKVKWRHIDNPLPELKAIQTRINRLVLSRVSLPEDMFGAAPGRDLVDLARQHENAPCVVTLDIRDFFPSTTTDDVYAVFRQVLGVPSRWAAPFTKLTTRFHRLPQGAPTSSYLAHLALLPARNEIAKLCRERSVVLSVYVDDFVFSGHRARELIGPAIEALRKHRFRVAQRKTKVMSAADVKIVTNIDVTKRVRAPEGYIKAVEGELQSFARHGSIPAGDLRSSAGKIQHIKRLCVEQSAPLESLLASLPVDPDGITTRKSETIWVRCPGRRHCRWEAQRRYKRK